jgi:hypothetical protein
MTLTPDHVRKTTVYLDREIEDQFRALLVEQGTGFSPGINTAMQEYLKLHGKPVNSEVRIRSRRLIRQGEPKAS